MAKIGGVTCVGLQWIQAQSNSLIPLRTGYAKVGDGRVASFADIAGVTALQGSEISQAGIAGRITQFDIAPSRNAMGQVTNNTAIIQDGNDNPYEFSELGIYNADDTLIFYVCETTVGESLAQKVARGILVYPALITLSGTQDIGDVTYELPTLIRIPDRSIVETDLAPEITAKLRTLEQFQDLVAAMFAGNTEVIATYACLLYTSPSPRDS